VADDRGKAEGPAAGKKADAPRNPDKDRIAELMLERDQLRFQIIALKYQLRAVAPPAPVTPDPVPQAERDRVDLRKDLSDVKARLTEMEKQQKALVDELRMVARAAAAPLAAPAPAEPAPPSALNQPTPAVVQLVPDPVPAAPRPSPRPGMSVPSPAAVTPGRDLTPSLTIPPADTAPPMPPAKPVVQVYPVGELAADAPSGDALAKVVRATVDPKSWAGDAGVEYLPGSKLLVVRQTKAGQDQVEELLQVLKVHAAKLKAHAEREKQVEGKR
jgi:hypothetical protein